MYAKGRRDLVIQDILDDISEPELLNYYLGISKIPGVINSPLRVDNNPSFGLNTVDGIKIHYKDFATNDSGGTFDLLQEYFHLSLNDLLNKIKKDLNSGLNDRKSSIVVTTRRKGSVIHSENTLLKCKVREWKQYDIDYWEQYGISLPWLKFANIYPISHVIITNIAKNKTYTFCADKYAYAYVEFKDNVESLKIYQPYNAEYKWTNNHDSSVWDLWEQLPETGDNLIITSSKKDAVCIWENTGIPSCSLQAESYIPKQQVVEELKQRFKNVYILYDNDFTSVKNYGRILGNKLATIFNLNQIEIPDKWKSKDTSDLAKNHGREIVKEVIFNLIKQ